ncbi:MAG: hypothetical protein GIW95_11790, partial [Candidatus Eremiobacteraeota bacterium]|nr:hypothetical protein [Candidatus Eremiobacteraeota bacterium]
RGPALPFVEQPAVRAYCAVTAPRIAAGGWRAWDFFDPATIYGPEIWAKPAPLEAVVILARAAEGRSRIERVPVTAAAFEVARGLDSDAQGLARVADLATTLAGVAAYRLTVGPDGDAADALIEAVA